LAHDRSSARTLQAVLLHGHGDLLSYVEASFLCGVYNQYEPAVNKNLTKAGIKMSLVPQLGAAKSSQLEVPRRNGGRWKQERSFRARRRGDPEEIRRVLLSGLRRNWRKTGRTEWKKAVAGLSIRGVAQGN